MQQQFCTMFIEENLHIVGPTQFKLNWQGSTVFMHLISDTYQIGSFDETTLKNMYHFHNVED